MFQVNMLPATFGDSFWVTYQDGGKEHRILIDGGTAGTRNRIHQLIKDLPEDDRHIDLVVVTHIDNDHIAGILTMLQRQEVELDFGDFWFNGRKHLPNTEEGTDDDEFLGSKQGEQLTDAIEDLGLPWNKAFDGDRVVIPDGGELPVIELPGGMKLTLLSPTLSALRDLVDDWDDELAEAGLLSTGPMLMDLEAGEFPADDDDDDFLSVTLPDIDALADSDFGGDGSSANGSSIAFMLEFEGKRAVFAADAHAPQMVEAFNQLKPDGKLKVDFFKVSHHGSKGTTSTDLVDKVACKRYAITTNGSNFHHPDEETIARILKKGGNDLELLFNYRSKHNKIWDNETLKNDFGYTTVYPDSDQGGLVVDV